MLRVGVSDRATEATKRLGTKRSGYAMSISPLMLPPFEDSNAISLAPSSPPSSKLYVHCMTSAVKMNDVDAQLIPCCRV